jgi:hypothetical protein
MVTPSLGGKHSNVAIMVEVNTLKGSTNTLADISDNDNTNTATTKNTTVKLEISQLLMSWLKACVL